MRKGIMIGLFAAMCGMLVPAVHAANWVKDGTIVVPAVTNTVSDNIALPNKFSTLDKISFTNESPFASTIAFSTVEAGAVTSLGSLTLEAGATGVFTPRPFYVTPMVYVTNDVPVTYSVTNYFQQGYTARKVWYTASTTRTNVVALPLRYVLFAEFQ